MSNFSYIKAIPLPILDITNTGKTIRDFDVDIATRIKREAEILAGDGSIYYNSNPETDTIGSNWPVGMSFEELCYFYWKVEYFNWGGTSANLPFEDGPLISWGGSYSPAAYPRISRILNDNCTDYLQKGDLYYATRIINHVFSNGENVRTCSFYDFPENDYFVFLSNNRTYNFGDEVPSINFDSCGYNSQNSQDPSVLNSLGLIAFWHPFAYLNDPARGGSGNPMDVFNFFPRIIKNENLYYPSIITNSLLGSAFGPEPNPTLQQVLVTTFGLLIKSPLTVLCGSGEEAEIIDGLEEEYVSETQLIDFKILNTTRKLFVFSASQRIVADCEGYPYETVNSTLGNILGMTANEEQPN